MLKDKLLKEIKVLIKKKGTFPPFLTFVQLKVSTDTWGESKEDLNKAFRELVIDKKITVRKGINNRLIEVL